MIMHRTLRALIAAGSLLAGTALTAQAAEPKAATETVAEPISASAPESRVSKVDGNRLGVICTARSVPMAQSCEAFIDGVADTIAMYQHQSAGTDVKLAHPVCVPASATGRQMHDIVLTWLHDHPEDRAHPAAQNVFHALRGAFPCH